ncbi:hypothetical protein J5N97_020595 [Dioscorea zingiberensis]|uniref:Partner of Nob1 n=1 Tax=Dioscorea zingiberensis TaxID=325984 RepID=A0A9D5CG48_9LILI|nr:hypothetical protein J5N97_020595 [Dioscorea zingiberensis]
MADQVGGASSMDVEVHRAEAAPARPQFAALKPHEMSEGKVQFRKVPVPPHRFSPLKRCWLEIYTPVYEQMKIDIRMNLKARRVELKTRSDTPDVSNLQKCADFVHAFMLGFDVADALASYALMISMLTPLKSRMGCPSPSPSPFPRSTLARLHATPLALESTPNASSRARCQGSASPWPPVSLDEALTCTALSRRTTAAPTRSQPKLHSQSPFSQETAATTLPPQDATPMPAKARSPNHPLSSTCPAKQSAPACISLLWSC